LNAKIVFFYRLLKTYYLIYINKLLTPLLFLELQLMLLLEKMAAYLPKIMQYFLPPRPKGYDI